MTVPVLDLPRAEEKLREEIFEALRRVNERSWYVLGKETESFEKSYAKYCEVSYALGVGCGTDALQLTLHALGVCAGDLVVTVANTAVPTVMAIRLCGAIPLFSDVDAKRGTMCPAALSTVLKSAKDKPKAIIPVHLYGQAAAMDEINEVAQQYQIPVIEDACQAHGARYKGKSVGSLSKAACFSFYPTKNLGCWGNGGIIVTNDQTLFEKLKLSRNLGQQEKYEHIVEGFNSQLDEVQAAILSVKLPYLNEWNNKRREAAAHYYSSLEGLPGLLLPVEAEWAHHVYHQYVIRLEMRQELRNYLSKNGIGSNVHYPKAIYEQQAYRQFKPERALPVTEKWCATVLSLPMFPGITEQEIQEVTKHIKNFLAQQ